MRGIARKEFDIVHKTIMEVGKRQFLEKGYEGANLRDLCKAADITASTFYCHFGDKHTLLSALGEEAAVGFEQLLRSCLDEISKKWQLVYNSDIQKFPQKGGVYHEVRPDI